MKTTKGTRLGTDSLGGVIDTTKKENKPVKPSSRHDGKKAKPVPSAAVTTALSTGRKGPSHQAPTAPARVKATYYLNPLIIKKLKHIAVDEDRDLSDLVDEALKSLIVKYSTK